MPPNLFGDNDNYDPKNSHVIASLNKKIREAKKNKVKNVYLWGDGTPKREFLHVDDLIEMSVKLLKISKKNIGAILIKIKRILMLVVDMKHLLST